MRKIKFCSKCQTAKRYDLFGVDKGTKDGLKAWCKECSRLYNGRTPEEARRYYNENMEQLLWTTAKRRAKKYKVPFTIKISDIKIPKKCPILDVELKRGTKHRFSNSPALDRKIPELGYVPENIWVISHTANFAKQKLSVEQLYSVCERLKKILCLRD